MSDVDVRSDALVFFGATGSIPRRSTRSAACCATSTATTGTPRRVVEQLAKMGTTHARVIVEKPFGHDVVSARKLNRALRGAFDEASIS